MPKTTSPKHIVIFAPVEFQALEIASVRTRFPFAQVHADSIFIRDGPLFTSAGVFACIDLALALIEEDHGRDLAVSVARHMAMYLKRPGGSPNLASR